MKMHFMSYTISPPCSASPKVLLKAAGILNSM